MKKKRYPIGAVLGVVALGMGTLMYSKLGAKPSEIKKAVQSSEQKEIYGIGSVSKMFGTVALMKLAEQEKIDLDESIVKYIPEFVMADERYTEITPRMLLNHTSGIMGTSNHNAMLFGKSELNYHESFLEGLKGARLKADPGAYSVYCNDGFTLAEILVERVSGVSFSEFVAKEITRPLGMTDTFTVQEQFEEEALAPIYYGERILPYENIQLLASGGLYGTPEDLCKFSQIFMKEGKSILSQESVAEMAKSWYLQDKIGGGEGESVLGYGLGWDSVESYPYNQYGITALTKGGDTLGYHTGLTVLPEQNLSIALTTSGGASTYCQLAVQEILLEVLKEEGLIDSIKPTHLPEQGKPVSMPKELVKYAGYYSGQGMMKIEFTQEDVLLITPLDGAYDTVQEYVYTEEGVFESTKGNYISGAGALVSTVNGNKGRTKLSFKEEVNGQIYLMGTTYEKMSGLGDFAISMPFAQKIEPHNLQPKVEAAWDKREGKKYYLVGETFNSNLYRDRPTVEVERVSQVPGYTASLSGVKNCKIIDEMYAKCEINLPGMIGRDLLDYTFVQEGNVEYMNVGDLLFVSEEAVKSTKDLSDRVVVAEEGYTQWYAIDEADGGMEITIEVSEEGAYYVYNKNEECLTSSILKEERTTFTLPQEGYLVLAGEKGVSFNIIK